MANRAFLLAHDSAAPIAATADEDAILAAANYSLPSLWLALFSLDSLSAVEVEFHDDSGNRTLEPVTTLMAPTADAVGRFDRRTARLLAALPEAMHGHVHEFRQLLGTISARHVQLDVAEISIMFGTADEFLADLKNSLLAADGETFADLAPLFAQAGFGTSSGRLAFDADEADEADVVRFWLRGYQWVAPVPWTD